jgi:hypothetical protein
LNCPPFDYLETIHTLGNDTSHKWNRVIKDHFGFQANAIVCREHLVIVKLQQDCPGPGIVDGDTVVRRRNPGAISERQRRSRTPNAEQAINPDGLFRTKQFTVPICEFHPCCPVKDGFLYAISIQVLPQIAPSFPFFCAFAEQQPVSRLRFIVSP